MQDMDQKPAVGFGFLLFGLQSGELAKPILRWDTGKSYQNTATW